MMFTDYIQALSALTSIAMILTGSLWLKKHLRSSFF